jgi:hypothetical protein
MTKKCRYPDKQCFDRYMSHSAGYLKCRLDEWKQKKGVCPYDKTIHSTFKHTKNKISYDEMKKNNKLDKWINQ